MKVHGGRISMDDGAGRQDPWIDESAWRGISINYGAGRWDLWIDEGAGREDLDRLWCREVGSMDR